MADEVIIVESKRPNIVLQGSVAPVLGEITTTQVLDIATASAEVNADTQIVRVISKGTGFWLLQGDTGLSAAADTDGNIWVGADTSIDLSITPGNRFFDTAADA